MILNKCNGDRAVFNVKQHADGRFAELSNVHVTKMSKIIEKVLFPSMK
jgi:hypothetical protein